MRTNFTDPLPFSRDGKTFFVLGRDVFELSASTHEVVFKIPLATPREAGDGALRRSDLYSPEPDIYYGGHLDRSVLEEADDRMPRHCSISGSTLPMSPSWGAPPDNRQP